MGRLLQDLEPAAREADRGRPGCEARARGGSPHGGGRGQASGWCSRRKADHPRAGAAQGRQRHDGGRQRRPRGADGAPRRPQRGHHAWPRARGRRRARARPLRGLVRDVSPFDGPRRQPRHVPRRRAEAALRLGHGLRRSLPASHPPHRQRPPQGAQQQHALHGRRPGQPLGHRLRRGRTQGGQPGARHAGGFPALRARGGRARAVRRAGHRVPVLTGPSLCSRTP